MCNDILFDRYCTRLFVGLFANRGTRIILDDDFHLQSTSPFIDRGDIYVDDVDGSRSDMGAYGGPDGE